MIDRCKTKGMSQGVVATPLAPMAPFPAGLDLTPVGRRPLRLPDETVERVLAGPLPTVSACCDPGAPAASVVIATFNNLIFNRLCLESVLANTQQPVYEIIVVDNGSSDGTPEYLRDLSRHHPHIRVVFNDQNRGFAAANNQGLEIARGGVLILLNNDTIVPPKWLDGLIRHLQEPAVGLVGPVTNRIGNEAEIDADYRTYGQFLEFEERNRREQHGKSFEIPTPCMYCLAMRRDVYERIGPLDERFRIGMLEDDDYALRARHAGYRLVCAEDVFIHHFGQASFGELVPTGEHSRLLEANKQQFEAKWGQPWKPYSRRRQPAYEDLRLKIRQAVASATPPGSSLVVISKGDDELLEGIRADGRAACHFPQAVDGSYAGFYPADSDEAICQLDVLRGKGAGYLLLPATARWWLDYYRGFKDQLESGLILVQDDRCSLYSLDSASTDSFEADAEGVNRG